MKVGELLLLVTQHLQVFTFGIQYFYTHVATYSLSVYKWHHMATGFSAATGLPNVYTCNLLCL